MGKHSVEEDKKINKRNLLIIVFLIVIIVIGALAIRNKYMLKINSNKLSKDLKTIEGEKLVLKSNSDYNKIIEYIFDKGTLKTVKIYEQFEEEEKYKEKKNTYNLLNDINVIKVDDKELSIEIEKKDFGTDKELSYDELYNKYIDKLIDIYTVVK